MFVTKNNKPRGREAGAQKEVSMRERKQNNRKKRHGGIKMMASALALTGICSGLFYGVSSSVLAMELEKTETVPTVYPTAYQSELSAQNQDRKADSGVAKEPQAASYHLLDDIAECYTKSTANDLTREEAAEIGIKLLEDKFDADLDGTYVYMGYCSGTETFPRAFWSGDVRMTDAERTPDDEVYTFMIDAVTGEYFSLSHGKDIDANVPLGPDKALYKDSSAFQEVVKDYVEEKKLLRTSVSKVELNCQGYSGNDPSISFDVYGTDGERILITMSRYNKAIRGIGSDASRQISDKAGEALEHGMIENAVAIPIN